MNFKRYILYIILFCSFLSCARKLNVSEIKLKINSRNTALFEGNVDQIVKNTPKKYLKTYGESSFRELLTKVYSNKKDPILYSNIGDLHIQDNGKCNSYSYYKVTYRVRSSQMTPYLDSIALLRNEKKYGEENVTFLYNSKILEISEEKSEILIFDKDHRWKIINYDMETLLENYGSKFLDCIEKVENN
jgi:hypothetical protein